MNEGGERGYCVLQFIKRLMKADFDGQASRRAVATGEDHPDIADVPRMHLRDPHVLRAREGAAHLVLAVRAACRADRGGLPDVPRRRPGDALARRGARHAARAAVQERLLRLLPARSAFESAGWAPGDPLLTVFFYVSFAD